MKAVKNKKRFWLRTIAALLALGLAGCALTARKDMLVGQAKRLVEDALSRGTDRTVTIGKIRGHLFGLIIFENIEVREPWLEGDAGRVLSVKELRLRYRFLDLVSKEFGSKILVDVIRPVLVWKPRVGLRAPEVPFMGWMRDWALTQRRNLVFRVRDMTVVLGGEGQRYEGIDMAYEGNTFSMDLPAAHMKVYGSDVTTVLRVEGTFELGPDVRDDALRGKIRTEGTVINWSPLAEEADFDFIFTEQGFSLLSSHFLGGIELRGQMEFSNDLNIDFEIYAKDYAVRNLSPFFKIDKALEVPGRLDIEARFKGSFWQPQVECRSRLYNGAIGSRSFQALDVNVTGVYPTVTLENSRILMDDGTAMQFANTTLEARELFYDKTYERLIAGAQQDTVIWGDWEISRPLGLNEQPEFLMQRLLGNRAKVSFKKSNEDERELQTTDSKPMEVGFEYRLKAEDSLKFNVKDDEEFVGVEHKMRF